MTVDSAAINQIAAEKLGGWRFGARGELRALPRLLLPGERVLTMAMGTLGAVKGRLCVATDRRLLLIGKLPLRPVRCESLSLEQISSLRVTPKDLGADLNFGSIQGSVTLYVINLARAKELASVLSGESDPTQALTKAAPRTADSLSTKGYLVALAYAIVALGTWAAIALWVFELLAFVPGAAIVAAGTAAQIGLRRSWRRVREQR